MDTVKPLLIAIVLFLGTFAPTGSRAQSTADTGDALEEIIVTATKREENLQKVSTSIAVVSGAELAERNITRTIDIVQTVPGVQITSPNTGSDNFYSIRGATQNDFSEHQEGPVAVYLDGVYQSQPGTAASQLFDTERVEILRGPQGTLFGRNATAGLVQYISVQPSADRNAYATVDYGSFNQVKVEGASNITLTDNLFARVSGSYVHADSYFHNLLAPPDKQPFNQFQRAARLQLLYKATDDLSFLLSVRDGGMHQRGGVYRVLPAYPDPNNHLLGTAVPSNVNVYGTCPGCDLFGQKNTYGFYTAAADNINGHDYAYGQGATLTVKDRFGGLNFTSISDYTGYWKDYNEDSDGTPSPEQTYPTHVNATQFSEELRLDNGAQGRLRWVGGLYALRISGLYYEGLTVEADTPPDFFGDNYNIETRSVAAFWQGDYDLSSKWTATFGIRETYDRKTDDYISDHHTGLYGNSPVDYRYIDFSEATYGDLAKISKADWSSRAALTYKATDDVLGYVSWNRGIKSGGFTTPVDPVGIDPKTYKFDEERLYAYEIGLKSEFLEHRLRVNADVYYYDYVNYQAFNFYGASQVDFNALAKIKGGEVEISVAPVKGLRINIGTAINDAKAYDIPLPDGTHATRTLGQAPHWSQTWSASYSIPNIYNGALTFGADASYRSPIYYYISDAPTTYEGGIYLQNFHIDYVTLNDRLTVGAWVQNAFNKEYFVNILDEASLGFAQRVVGTPRWVGIKFSYRWP